MKKIILFLMILLINVKVEAKIYYSSYSDYQNVDYLMEETDLIKVKQEDKYLIYKENILEQFYPSYEIVEGMIKTAETKIVTSDWLDLKPLELSGRRIIEQEFFEYQDIKNIRYIKLNNISQFNTPFGIYRLQIYNKNELINYDITCSDCDKVNLEKIKNKNSNEFYNLQKDNKLVIDLKENVAIQNLKIAFVIYVDESKDIDANISLLGEENKEIYFNYRVNTTIDTSLSNSCVYNLKINHFSLQEPIYEKFLSLEEKEVSKFAFINKVLKYQTEDLYIKYYTITKEYLNDYFLEALDGFKLDLNSKKSFYYFKQRDKLEVKNRLIIDNYNTKLKDLVLYNSTNNIKITSNINYLKNGEYDISFILPFKTIKTKVIVDIKENYIKALKEMNKQLVILEENNNKLFIQNNNMHVQIKEVLENTDKKIKDNNEKILKYQYENNELKKDKTEFTEDKDSNFKIKKSLIIFVFLLILVLLKILRKKSIQNNN